MDSWLTLTGFALTFIDLYDKDHVGACSTESQMNKTKTLYEILGASPQASHEEIQAAHLREVQKLQSQAVDLDPDGTERQLKELHAAYQTLSTYTTRKAYDLQLDPPTAPTPLALTPVPANANSDLWSLKADAVVLRADAAALKADAAMLKADALSIRVGGTPRINVPAPAKGARRVAMSVLTILGAVLAIGMVVQVVGFMLIGSSNKISAAEQAKAHERVIIQEYYQRTGVKAGSKAEVERLEAEEQRAGAARNQAEMARREVARDDRNSDNERKRFVEESRQLAEQVSQKLQRDIERAEMAERLEAERQERRLQEEKLQKEYAERRRIEAERRRLGLY